jgi:hypothetical protein
MSVVGQTPLVPGQDWHKLALHDVVEGWLVVVQVPVPLQELV